MAKQRNSPAACASFHVGREWSVEGSGVGNHSPLALFLLACEEVDARRASAGQTEEFLADGYTAQQSFLSFAALFVSPCLGVRLV